MTHGHFGTSTRVLGPRDRVVACAAQRIQLGARNETTFVDDAERIVDLERLVLHAPGQGHDAVEARSRHRVKPCDHRAERVSVDRRRRIMLDVLEGRDLVTGFVYDGIADRARHAHADVEKNLGECRCGECLVTGARDPQQRTAASIHAVHAGADQHRRRQTEFGRDLPGGVHRSISAVHLTHERRNLAGEAPSIFRDVPPTITLVPRSPDDEVARELFGELNTFLASLYPPEENHTSLPAADVADGRGVFLVALQNDQPIGCGAVRLLDDGRAEIKRMYVRAQARGLGIGRQLLDALETHARQLGAHELVLETGPLQIEAVALYERNGFVPCPCWGEYLLTPASSLCMAKPLS